MKYLKIYEDFKSGKIENYNYISLEKIQYGLKITINSEGMEILEDADVGEIKSENIMFELFEDVRGNSEYEYHSNMGDIGLGLTSAPGITDGFFINDEGDFEENESAEAYFFSDYMIINFIEKLMTEKSVVFNKA